MDLGRLNRNAEDRSVVWAALVTAFLGAAVGLEGVAAHLNGRTPDAWINLVMAIVYFALASGVYRGSRVAAVAVVTIYLLNASLTVLVVGVGLWGLVWTVVLGGLLWGGMRGVFAQAARAPRPGPGPGVA